ncbi:MAG: extradiol ring-cleavage dioxygenase, partial [Dehalococcoidia bacterium]|nr:extradiol ring-cleavage dioxygenase [Dehalococcoidia bacterium]
MGDILCVGGSHHPGFGYPDEAMADILRRHLKSPQIPAEAKDPANWPPEMVEQFGLEGERATASAAVHRERVIGAYRKIRAEIDAFAPDFILIWGDDQYENFHEDLIPPFCIFVADQFETKPYARRGAATDAPSNIWTEPADTVAVTKSHASAAKYLARKLLEEGYAIPYSYKGLHHEGLAHAFMNTVNYLDYDRTGFGVPVVPFHVNCYGSAVVRNRGGDTL